MAPHSPQQQSARARRIRLDHSRLPAARTAQGFPSVLGVLPAARYERAGAERCANAAVHTFGHALVTLHT
jgi:hypothetical protein